MLVSYILIVVLLLHIFLFKKIIFKWNVFGVFFIATILFSTIGIIAFPFFKDFFLKSFASFKIDLISDSEIFKTQIIAIAGLLLALYAYVFGLYIFYGKAKCINHFKIEGQIEDNLDKVIYYFLIMLILLFIIIYLFLKRDIFFRGVFEGLIGREPGALLISRREITSNYVYVIITYNLLPFLTVISLYLSIKKRTLLSKIFFIVLLVISFSLILLLFQKRPLIIFLMALFISAFVFKKNIFPKKEKRKKIRTKKEARKRFIIYGSFLFSLLMLLYYSATTYQFQNVFEAIAKLSEVTLSRIFGRLSVPAFFYVHYFPRVEDYYYLSNIGALSKIFNYDHFADTKVLFEYFSRSKKDGSLAINSSIDFYGSFGYFGVIFGNLFLGFFLCTLDVFLNKLEKNNINLIFIVFCFVFAYYLSQASLPRALMGYGFIFFTMTWIFLQKGFKIKLR